MFSVTPINKIIRPCYTNSPPFRSPILEPGFHLGVRHLQGLGQLRTLGRRQVFLTVEAFLQLNDLEAGERRSWLLPFRRRPVLVGVADPPRNC